MATYVKGDAVANASGYELLEKVGETYNSLAEASEINFEVSAMDFAAGDHLLAVKAKGDGVNYSDSDPSETVTYTVEDNSEANWTEVLYFDDLSLSTSPTNSGATFAALGSPIAANTPISVIDIIQFDGVTRNLENVNIYVGNADTGAVTEHIVQGQSVSLITSEKTNKPVGRFVINKTYSYPVFLAVSADRKGSGTSASGVVYGTDPAGSVHWFAGTAPAVGDTLTASSAYAPYIAVYSY